MIKQMKFCTVPDCTYPEGQCSGACWSDDEARMDIIGQNGNDGDHYDAVDTAEFPPHLHYQALHAVDMINHPPHYTQGGIECIDAMRAALSPEQYKGYLKGAAFKYLWRLDHKGNAEENAEKAIWYLKKLREVL